MTTVRRRPVPRLRVLGSAVLIVVALFAIGAMTELLRHPLPSGQPVLPPELDAPGADPRDEVLCPEPEPREGQPRIEVDVAAYRQVTSSELYDCPQTYDATTVRYRGEVVGAILWRGDEAWVHLNDDVYGETLGPLPTHRAYRGGNSGVGVLLPRQLAEQIETVGGPEHQGDVLEVTAVFHRVHGDSAEVAVLEALQGQVVGRGGTYDNPVLTDRLVVAVVAVPLALALVVWRRLQERRR